MSGWFAVKRGITSHPVFKGDMAKIGFFLWLMENAAYKPTDIDIAGKPHTVPRGSLCYSQRFMAEKSGMSVKALRTFLKSLSDHGIISMEVVQTGKARETTRTQVTLCNYEKYQSVGNNGETTGKQPGNEDKQGNNTPVGKAAAAPSPDRSSVVDLSNPNAAVWAIGKAYLGQFPDKVKDPGSAVGGLLKAANGSAADLIGAIEAAKRAGTQDPMPYLRAALKPKHIQEREEMRRVQSLWL